VTLKAIEDFIYRIPMIYFLAVPLMSLLLIVYGPVFKRFRYNRISMATTVTAIAFAAYFIYYYLNIP
jgi:hypothetical protein